MKRKAIVLFTSDLRTQGAPLPHFWEHTVGSGHALLALRADWQAQLRRCHDELGFRYVRFHGLLCDDVGTFVIEQDKPVYSFLNSDRIFDFLLSIGMKPFVELSFMPDGLASGPDLVFHYRGNVTPPKNYRAWGKLICRLVKHRVDRYGLPEVRSWFFEVWNEPNLKAFWTGSRHDYFKLYKTASSAIKRVDLKLRVGGPATAMNGWIEKFIRYCAQNTLPVDFISTHHYPTDALGKPGDDTVTQLAASPRSTLRLQASNTAHQAGRLPVFYTEWSSSSNPADRLHDQPYAAAFIVKTILEANGLVDGYSFWTFSDIFEENHFRSPPFHGGFGLLNVYGIPKPSYRAFQILHSLGTEILPTEGCHPTVDAWCIRNVQNVTVLLTNWERPRHIIRTEIAEVRLKCASPPLRASVRVLDENHGNAYRKWLETGRPQYPNKPEVMELMRASKIYQKPQRYDLQDEGICMKTILAPQSVTAIDLQFR